MSEIDLCMAFYRAVKERSRCIVPKCKCHDTQMHHVHPRDKIAEIIKLVRLGDFSLVVAEFNKCIPLCDKHHRQVHTGARTGYLVGQFDNHIPTYDDKKARKFMPYLSHIGMDARRFVDELNDNMNVPSLTGQQTRHSFNTGDVVVSIPRMERGFPSFNPISLDALRH